MHTHYNYNRFQSLVACFIFAFCATVSAQTTTITLKPFKDNTLYQTSDGTLSNGAGDHLFCGKTAVGLLRRALIQFDVATIPSDAKIESVTLTMQVSNAVGGARAVKLHRVVRNWGEGTSNAEGPEGMGIEATNGDATWLHANFPSESWYTPGGDFLPNVSASTNVDSDGTYNWTSDLMKEDVQAWVKNQELNFGWILVGDEGTDKTAKRFDAKESEQPPTLTIRYTKSQNDSRLPAKIQFIHNAADPSITNINVAINEQTITTGLAFRTATPFIEVPSNRNLVLKIAASRNIAGQRRAQVNIPIRFEAGKTYVLFANGVLSPNLFDSRVNPDIKVNLYALENARTTSQGGQGYVDIVAFQGVTDVPAIDVFMPQLQQKVVEGLEYARFTEYVSLPAIAGQVQIDVIATRQGVKIESYLGDLSQFAGQAVTIFASGFLNPTNNRAGAPFGLFIAQPDGKVVEINRLALENRTELSKDTTQVEVISNGLEEQIILKTKDWAKEKVQIEWYDLNGRVLRVQTATPVEDMFQIAFPSNLPSAYYWVVLRQPGKRIVRQVLVR